MADDRPLLGEVSACGEASARGVVIVIDLADHGAVTETDSCVDQTASGMVGSEVAMTVGKLLLEEGKRCGVVNGRGVVIGRGVAYERGCECDYERNEQFGPSWCDRDLVQ